MKSKIDTWLSIVSLVLLETQVSFVKMHFSTVHVFFKGRHFHLAWSVLSTVSIDKNSSSPSWDRNPFSAFQAFHNSRAPFERKGTLSSSACPVILSSRPLRSASQGRSLGAERSLKERRPGARERVWDGRPKRALLKWGRDCAKPTSSAGTGERRAPARDGVLGGLVPSAWALPARSRLLHHLLQAAPRLSPPSEGHWYIPADSESLKRAREAKSRRFGPDLCSLRSRSQARYAALGAGSPAWYLARDSLSCGSQACGGFVCVAVSLSARVPRPRSLGSLSSSAEAQQ